MYYELYVDSLFLVNFVMNLYLLLLTNRSVFCTATRKRLILGACIGALFFILPFCFKGPMWIKILFGFLPGSVVMLVITFKVRTVAALGTIAGIVLKYSVLFGGTMVIIRKIPLLRKYMTSIWGILGAGALIYLLIGWMKQRGQQSTTCTVSLFHCGNRIIVTALVDSGNSLVEPISGKPVSVISKDTWNQLRGNVQDIYRAIPYRSIGRSGILKGYLLQEMEIKLNGVTKICRDVYVAVPDEYTASEGMILNPLLLKS